MRSHVTAKKAIAEALDKKFQYRKRYEVTCDGKDAADAARAKVVSIPQAV